MLSSTFSFLFFFNDTATTGIYTFPTRRSSDLFHEQHPNGPPGDPCMKKLPEVPNFPPFRTLADADAAFRALRSEEHTSELQSQFHLVCRLLLEKKKKKSKLTRPHVITFDTN